MEKKTDITSEKPVHPNRIKTSMKFIELVTPYGEHSKSRPLIKMQPYVQQISKTGPNITYVNVNNLIATLSIVCS